MDPEYWAVAVETVDGQSFSWGDDEVDFSIQSCSKPLMYCLGCEELGVEEVHQYIGCEPSGARFNAFALTEDQKPFNPFVNTGKY
jgi:glutaminase